MSDLENQLFKKRISDTKYRNEVFVTGLPRAGTTLLMSLLYSTGDFGTFTYRQMPFILAPLLWDKLSKTFQKKAESRERAHGDGMQVSYDSPEAFEEILWLTHFRKKIVAKDRLCTLNASDYENNFAESFRDTIVKCLILEQDSSTGVDPLRYLSKNNANISRLPLLRKLFPDAHILVPFRHPLAHISSLAAQHKRFLEQHGRDKFSRQYMFWLGHFEFGKNFKPIDFNGWLGKDGVPEAIDYDFWIRYWNAAYKHLLAIKGNNIHFVDFEKLLQYGTTVLGNIADTLGLRNRTALVSSAVSLRVPTTKPVDESLCLTNNLEKALTLYENLRSVAL